VAVLVLGGLQLLSLGIIGEYLGRLHLNVNRKPQYTIRHAMERRSGAGAAGDLQDADPQPASLRDTTVLADKN